MSSKAVARISENPGRDTTGHGQYAPRASRSLENGGGIDTVFVDLGNGGGAIVAGKSNAGNGTQWDHHPVTDHPHTPLPDYDTTNEVPWGDSDIAFPVVTIGAGVEADAIAVGSSTVFAGKNVYAGTNTGVDLPTIPNIAIIEGDDDDAVEPGSGASYVAGQVTAGNLSSTDLAKGSTLTPGSSTTTIPRAVQPATTDVKDIQSISPFPSGDAIDAIQLSGNFTVGKLTRKPYVTFDNPLRAPSAGLSIDQVVANLKLLAVNVIEPIKAKYPNAFVTNTFRPAKAGATKYSQHNLGQACDIQFRGIAKSEYYNIALWVKDNIPYDQMLLEYKTTGSGLPWIHLSFKTNSRSITDPTKIMTFLNDSKYAVGLVQLA